jgi:diguanylate cyclase (GGDEF)-like protein
VIMLMNDMADLLQSCRTVEEFCSVVSTFAARIFAGESGSIFVVNASRSAIERVASWGQENAVERVFAPDACWALRRGRLHRSGADALGPRCEHNHSTASGKSICVPMMGQGEALGILHVQEASAMAEGEIGAAMAESRLRTIISVAEHIALALANLKLRDTLRMQAIRDPLTGLFNRRYMEETLDREIARAARSGSSLAAVMIDIDHFKRYNDMFGHAAADVALRETASVIRAALQGEDVACRFGGEELLVILPETTLDEAVARAEVIRMAISAQQIRYRGTALGRVTASFGVATVPGQAQNAEGVLRAADEALYEAKAGGRDRVCVARRPTQGTKGASIIPIRDRDGTTT